VNRWWSYFFGVVLLAALALFVAAPFVGWWLPKDVSSYGYRVDGLFYFILGITGFFFILVEALLVYFMYVYAERPSGQEHPVSPRYAEEKGALWTSVFKSAFRPVSALLHDQHRIELAWTIVPAAILLIIAFAQINAWADIKDPSNMPADPDVTMVVSARMYEWRVRYPSTKPAPEQLASWAVNPEIDDVHVVNEVHTWKDAKVKVFLQTRDIIHSFYLPNLRLKQDALPGKTIPVWFQVIDYNTVPVDLAGRVVKGRAGRVDHWADGYDPDTGELGQDHQVWELACAELCGWGHYKMRGKLFVHEDKADYQRWLAAAKARQNSTRPSEE
jgi:cytochrome c oxidase subunit 2